METIEVYADLDGKRYTFDVKEMEPAEHPQWNPPGSEQPLVGRVLKQGDGVQIGAGSHLDRTNTVMLEVQMRCIKYLGPRGTRTVWTGIRRIRPLPT